MPTDNVLMRTPAAGEGLEVQRLISNNPPLDSNSPYCYYLLCRHFSDTCVVAEHQGEIAGFLSAYVIPDRPDTLFVWQVVVSSALRGKHIASRMLDTLLARFDKTTIRAVESTVNPSNTASRRLFESLARQHGTGISEEIFLDAAAFGPATEHQSEILLHITLQHNTAELDTNRKTGEET